MGAAAPQSNWATAWMALPYWGYLLFWMAICISIFLCRQAKFSLVPITGFDGVRMRRLCRHSVNANAFCAGARHCYTPGVSDDDNPAFSGSDQIHQSIEEASDRRITK